MTTKNYISEENKKRLDAAVIAWEAAGHRIWPDQVMAAVFSRQLSCLITKTHVNHARIRTDRKVTGDRPMAVPDVAHLADALGLIPAPPVEPDTGLLFTVRADLLRAQARIDAALRGEP